MASIAETTTEMAQLVFPEHAGAPGQIHGGRMMQWITQAGTMAAGRVARGMVVLGAMDDIDFLAPVRVGVRVWAENVATGRRAVTLNSHLVLVSVDDAVRPRPVADKIVPSGPEEAAVFEAARRRREQRLARFAQRAGRHADAGHNRT